MIPDFPKVKDILLQHHKQFFDRLVKLHLGPLFGNIPRIPMYEGTQMIHNYQEGFSYQNDLEKMEVGFTAVIPDHINNPLIIYDRLNEMAADFAKQQATMILNAVSEVTELAGNVVSGDKGITPEIILEMWERLEISFDEYGNPMKYSIVAGQETLNKFEAAFIEMEQSEDYKNKMEALVDKKRKTWYDRENNRKLVG